MVGGTVLEVCDNSNTSRKAIYVNVGDDPYGKLEQCAINVEVNNDSREIQIGDLLWWQGGFAMWTPADKSRIEVRIPRVGYSGVRHPYEMAVASSTE